MGHSTLQGVFFDNVEPQQTTELSAGSGTAIPSR